MTDDWFLWIPFFAAPLGLVAIIAWVFRPSARHWYGSAAKIPFDQASGRQERRDEHRP